jgi:predicted small lipoprotein YifL
VAGGAKEAVVRVLLSAVVALSLATLAGCTSAGPPAAPSADRAPAAESASSATVTGLDPPAVGNCRVLSPDALEEPTDDSPTVPCRGPHTAETFAVGEFTGRLAQVAVDDERLSEEVLDRCERRFRRYVGADASLALRTVLTWAWFRPFPEAWEAGARWYRCDLVAADADGLLELRGRAHGVLLGRPADRWLLCAVGERVGDAPRVPCDQPHSWRAVTTVVLGDAAAPWPGARRAELRTRDFCSDSVGAWLGYPVDYAYGFTWLGRAEWQAGNRRSVCWARTDR